MNRPMRDALRHGRLMAERDAIVAVIPADPSIEIRAAELQRSRLEKERKDLATGSGRYRDHPVTGALRERSAAETNVARLERNLADSARRKDERAWRAELEEWRPKLAAAARDVADLTTPELARLDKEDEHLRKRLDGLWRQHQTYQSWVSRFSRGGAPAQPLGDRNGVPRRGPGQEAPRSGPAARSSA